MKTTARWVVAAGLIALAGCSGGSGGSGEKKAPIEMAPGTSISEAEFKALHELRREKAPAVRGEMIEIAGSRAYLSLPAGAPPLPGVVLIHEWWGLNDHIMHWADRLAAEGYAAIAVDLYGGRVADNPDSAMAYVNLVQSNRSHEILSAALARLKEDPRIQAARRGTIGWCFGGGWSLQAALRHPDLDAAVIYYGRLETDPAALAAIKAHVCGIFANRDRSIPPDTVDAFERALEEAGISHQIHRYDAEHAFANPSAARYDSTSAAGAWEVARAFLSEHVKG
jgi:carboxymethylenebutenolidase